MTHGLGSRRVLAEFIGTKVRVRALVEELLATESDERQWLMRTLSECNAPSKAGG
jgi:hypothetical protein